MIDYDPARDEFKEYSLKEFREIMEDSLRQFVEDAKDAPAELKKGTFNEWLRSFIQWMSW